MEATTTGWSSLGTDSMAAPAGFEAIGLPNALGMIGGFRGLGPSGAVSGDCLRLRAYMGGGFNAERRIKAVKCSGGSVLCVG